MAEGGGGWTILGSIGFRFGLLSTVPEDVAVAKKEVQGFGQTVSTEATKTRAVYDRMGADVSRTSTAIGRGMLAVGAGIVGTSIAAKSLGFDMREIEPIAMAVGGSLMGVGGALEVVGRASRAIDIAATSGALSEMAGSVMTFASAHPYLIAIGLAITGIAAGYALLTTKANIATESMRSQDDVAKDLTKTYADLTNATDRLKDKQDELAGIPKRLEDLYRDLEGAMLDVEQRESEYQKALGRKGALIKEQEGYALDAIAAQEDETAAVKRNDAVAAAMAKRRKEDSMGKVDDLQREIDALGTVDDTVAKTAKYQLDVSVARKKNIEDEIAATEKMPEALQKEITPLQQQIGMQSLYAAALRQSGGKTITITPNETVPVPTLGGTEARGPGVGMMIDTSIKIDQIVVQDPSQIRTAVENITATQRGRLNLTDQIRNAGYQV